MSLCTQASLYKLMHAAQAAQINLGAYLMI